jgi:hypothetical protein
MFPAKTASLHLFELPGAAQWMQRFTTRIVYRLLEVGDNRNFRLQRRLAFSRTGYATPSFLLQFLDLFRSFRFGPVLAEFFSGFTAERLEI